MIRSPVFIDTAVHCCQHCKDSNCDMCILGTSVGHAPQVARHVLKMVSQVVTDGHYPALAKNRAVIV